MSQTSLDKSLTKRTSSSEWWRDKKAYARPWQTMVCMPIRRHQRLSVSPASLGLLALYAANRKHHHRDNATNSFGAQEEFCAKGGVRDAR
jgi:hypothetical protein